MSRMELVKRLAEFATRPLAELRPAGPSSSVGAPGAAPKHQVDEHDPYALDFDSIGFASGAPVDRATALDTQDLYVWFEDTSTRQRDGRRGVAGLPESLLPYARGMRVIERRYVDGHLHLLSAVRLRCREQFGERIAALYTAALSVGTVAWIGTGTQYARAWREMYPYAAPASDPSDPNVPDFPSEI
jgi:hypothetical protein